MRLVFLSILILTGCAPGVARRVPLSPAALAKLETEAAGDSADIATRIKLGAAYRDLHRPGEASVVLESVTNDDPSNAGAFFLLGLTREDLEDWPGSRVAYEQYMSLGGSTDVKQAVASRLKYVHRRELQASVVRLAEEERAGQRAGPAEPRTLAVFPFLYQGDDQSYGPLGRALAEMLVTDLSQTDRLRVLERLQVQLLLDELALDSLSLVDPATAARSGRLLRAGRVVQGAIDIAALRLDLNAFLLQIDQQGPPAQLTDQDDLQRLFDVEKRVAVGLYASAGVELTVAERERVMRRATENINALLAFGRGLEAEDRGDYRTAAREYDQAASIDPGFDLARAKSLEVTGIGDAEQMRIAVVLEKLSVDEGVELPGEQPTGTVPAASSGSASTLAGISFSPTTSGSGQIDGIPDVFRRDPGAEVLGQETVTVRTILRILFIRPSN
jgi:TolB-like protein